MINPIMEKLIKRFQAHSGLASVGVSFLVLAASLIVPPLSDLQNQPTFTSNPLFWVGLVFTLLAIWTFYYALIRKPPTKFLLLKIQQNTAIRFGRCGGLEIDNTR